MSAAPVAPHSRARHFFRRALPTYWIFLFCVTHFPKLELGGPSQSDKYSHLVAYGLLAYLLWMFFAAGQRPVSSAFVWKVLVTIAIYGAVDELTQSLVGRGTDIMDWIADMVGAGLVLAVLEWRRRVRVRQGRPAASASGGI